MPISPEDLVGTFDVGYIDEHGIEYVYGYSDILRQVGGILSGLSIPIPDYFERIIEVFPDVYDKGKGSNFYKLISTITPEFDEILSVIQDIQLNLDIEKATGATLTKLATNVNQQRGRVNDKVLRTLIKSKIASDMSEGTIETILNIVSFIFGDELHQTQIVELWHSDTEEQLAAFRLYVPIEGITESGITLNQFVQVMTKLKSAGVAIYADLQGTFEFGLIEEFGIEFENGFSDITGVVGGTLGVMFDPEEDEPLPI